MLITVVCDVLGEANNGTTLASYNFINKLKLSGVDVHILCCDQYKKGEPGYYVLGTFNFGFFNNYVSKNGVAIAKYDEKVIDEACRGSDLIHVMLPFAAGKAAAQYAHLHNIPLTAGFHCQAENITAHLFLKNVRLANRTTYHILWKRLYQYCDAIHYPTEFIKQYCDDRGYDKVKHKYVISNGVQTELFHPIEVTKKPYLKNKFTIIMSGRLSKEKEQKSLLKAVKKSKYERNIQIILCGDGPLRQKLLTWGFKNLTNVPIIRIFPHNELASALSQGDLYVHTSGVEIEAISCLEAIACGLVPVIANSPKSATSKFALHPNNSYKYHSTKDLTKKIDYWYEHEAERKQVRSAYIEYTKQFDFSRCMDRMYEMVMEVIKRGKVDKPWVKLKKK